MDIAFKKSQIRTLYAAVFLFSMAALFLIFMPPVVPHTLLGSAEFFYVIAGLLLLAAFGLFRTAQKRKNSRIPGMRVTELGIQDNSSKMNTDFVSWEDISGFELQEVVSSKFIAVKLKNPEAYINKAKGWRKEQLVARYKDYGSPFCVAITSLDISTLRLLKVFEEHYNRYYGIEEE